MLTFIALIHMWGCGGGGSVPPVQNPNGSEEPDSVVSPVAGGLKAVHIQLSEVGDDIKVTGKVVSPLLQKTFNAAKIAVASSEKNAGLVVHGTVTLRHQNSDRRLGLDHHEYAAQATWQIIVVSGYRSILSRETVASGKGTGKFEAVTNTLTNLANQMSTELVPRLQRELGAR